MCVFITNPISKHLRLARCGSQNVYFDKRYLLILNRISHKYICRLRLRWWQREKKAMIYCIHYRSIQMKGASAAKSLGRYYADETHFFSPDKRNYKKPTSIKIVLSDILVAFPLVPKSIFLAFRFYLFVCSLCCLWHWFQEFSFILIKRWLPFSWK